MLGSGGSGKSTLSCQLSQRTGLPLIHLDKEYWRPGWVKTPKAEWRKRVEEIVKGDQWIVDGNFTSSLDIRIPRCDCVLLLHYSRVTCILGVIKRVLSGLGKTRPDMGRGCPERVDLGFLKWVWNFQKNDLPKIWEQLDRFPDKTVIVLKSRKQAQKWLESRSFSKQSEKTVV